MKINLTLLLLLAAFGCYAQNVSINNVGTPADASAMLDVKSTTKGMLVPRVTEAERIAIVNPANALLVYQTNGQAGFYYNNGNSLNPDWVAIGAANNSWTIKGNSVFTTGTLGTLSNNHMDLISNNIVRGRLTNLGEFFIGTVNTTFQGDLMGVVSNAGFPFAVSGYSGNNGAGVYGVVQTGVTQFAGVQGEFQSSAAGIFNTAGVRGSNQSTVAGTGFRTQNTTGPRIGVIGNTTVTNGQYTFGVHGSMGSTDMRCGGLFGDDFGIAMGAIGYYAASLVDYSVYGFGNAFQTGIPGGRSAQRTPVGVNTQIGLGIYGGVMGGWIRGLVYGTHVKGERYSLYVDGKTYTNEPVAELVAKTDGTRIPAYGVITEQPDVYAKGKSRLVNGSKYISFSEAFLSMAKPDDIVITVSPLASSNGLYIAKQDAAGFWVNENNAGNGMVDFAWMAIATRKGFEQLTHAPELLEKDFDQKMSNVMYNDNNKTGSPQSIWWDGQNVRFDTPPVKKPLTDYQPATRAQ